MREWKSGELGVLVLAITVAVAALTGVGFLVDRISIAVDNQAGEVLAADLVLQSSQPIDDRAVVEARRRGLSYAYKTGLLSVVFNGDASQLSALRAVSAGYPLRGKVMVSNEPFGAAAIASGIPGRGEVWPESRLAAAIGATVGSELSIGAGKFRVSRILISRPDQGATFVELAPSLLMNDADIEGTQLIQPGSRLTRAQLFAGPRAEIQSFSRLAQGQQERIRAPARRRRDGAADQVGHRPFRAFPEPGEPGRGVVVRHRRGHGGAALRAAAPGFRGPHEDPGRDACLHAHGEPHAAHPGGPGRGGSRLDTGFWRASLAGGGPQRLVEGRPAAARPRAAGHRVSDRGRRARWLCTATAPAAVAYARPARPAARRRSTSPAGHPGVRPGRARHRLPDLLRAARRHLLSRVRRRARGFRRDRGRRRLAAGDPHQAGTRRSRRLLALRAREPRAAPHRKRGAADGIRARHHDAAAAGGGAQRPAERLAPQPACRYA